MHYFLIFFAFGIHFVEAFHFIINDGVTKCFVQDLPIDTLLKTWYKIDLFDRAQNAFVHKSVASMHVEIKDPHEKILLSRKYSAQGHITFTSHSRGEFFICLTAGPIQGQHGKTRLRVYLEFKVAEHAIDYSEVARVEKLTSLQLKARQLLDKLETIQKNQQVSRAREASFREHSGYTQKLVLWSLPVHCGLLVIAGISQYWNLKTFLKAKKIV